jgi:hypothetical protein
VSQYTRLKDPDSSSTATLGELKAKTTFANAGLSDEAHYMTFTPNRIFELFMKGAVFACSTSERAQPNSTSKNAA